MKTTIRITDHSKFNSNINDVDTSELKCTDNYNGTRTFAANGHLSIETVNDGTMEIDGEFGSKDYVSEFGFELIPLD